MVRIVLGLILALCTTAVWAQRAVDPNDLALTITLEDMAVAPYEQEMVLLTIHGVYRRHITREKLEQPDFAGFNWMQMGQDHWYESELDGRTVKNMRRRMAIFPQKAGRLEIGPFVHHLTLLDENNNWFQHKIESAPLVLDVQPAPQTDAWWFPVRRLEITDRWSNAPDQLAEGEGVLRIITISALGASLDMIPPMPELRSPSAHIFPHPEKRLVDLTPRGPVSIAFWRWTIKPRDPPSAILEPIEFSFFDTVERKMRTARISAQRVAMADGAFLMPEPAEDSEPVSLRAGAMSLAMLAAFMFGLGPIIGAGRHLSFEAIGNWLHVQTLKRTLRNSARKGDLAALRRASQSLNRIAGPNAKRDKLIADLDSEIFGRPPQPHDLSDFYRSYLLTL